MASIRNIAGRLQAVAGAVKRQPKRKRDRSPNILREGIGIDARSQPRGQPAPKTSVQAIGTFGPFGAVPSTRVIAPLPVDLAARNEENPALSKLDTRRPISGRGILNIFGT